MKMSVEICEYCDLEEIDCECGMYQVDDLDDSVYDSIDAYAEYQQEMYDIYRNEY